MVEPKSGMQSGAKTAGIGGRREFLLSAGAIAAASALSHAADDAPAKAKPAPAAKTSGGRAGGYPIGVSTYSFWQFKNEDLRDIEKCIDLAAEWGFDALEILHRQMTSEENGYLQRLKRRSFVTSAQDSIRSDQDVLRRWTLVLSGTRLRPHCRDASATPLSRLYLTGV